MDIFSVSKLGFGTSQIGGPAFIGGRMVGAKPIPKKEAIDILRCAYDSGINFFDTADKYGDAEDLLGEVFSKMRDKVVIATKCGLTDKRGRNFSIPYVSSCLENSLKKLKTDYVDIFQLTKPGVQQVTNELLSFIQKKIKEGKIRYFGISLIGNNDGEVYLSKRIIKSFQIFYNLLFTGSHELIEKCAKNDKFVIIRSPLNSGVLSGKYTTNIKFDKVDFRNRIFRGKLLKERLECVEKIKKHFNLSSGEILMFSLNFILSNKDINVVIPAASKIRQLKNYIKIFNKRIQFDETQLMRIINFLQDELCPLGKGQFKQ